MAQDGNSAKHRAVVPGKAILGVAGAARANKATLGGAVVPGKAILGDEGAQQEAAIALAARKKVEALDAKNTPGPKVKPDLKAKAEVASPRDPKAKPEKKKGPEPGMSEAEAVAKVDADPNTWPAVLELEVARKGGVRQAVAVALVAAGAVAADPAMPEDVLAKLKEVAGDEDGD